MVPLELRGDTQAKRQAIALLEKVGLEDRIHHYPAQLSGGEQQRIAIARALANEPSIVLADEPTGNLDSANGGHIVELLLEVNRSRGTTIVLGTHDSNLAKIAQVTLAMRDGHIQSKEML